MTTNTPTVIGAGLSPVFAGNPFMAVSAQPEKPKFRHTLHYGLNRTVGQVNGLLLCGQMFSGLGLSIVQRINRTLFQASRYLIEAGSIVPGGYWLMQSR